MMRRLMLAVPLLAILLTGPAGAETQSAEKTESYAMALLLCAGLQDAIAEEHDRTPQGAADAKAAREQAGRAETAARALFRKVLPDQDIAGLTRNHRIAARNFWAGVYRDDRQRVFVDERYMCGKLEPLLQEGAGK